MAGDWIHYTLCYRRDPWLTFGVLALAQMMRSKTETVFFLIFKTLSKPAQFSFLQFKTRYFLISGPQVLFFAEIY